MKYKSLIILLYFWLLKPNIIIRWLLFFIFNFGELMKITSFSSFWYLNFFSLKNGPSSNVKTLWAMHIWIPTIVMMDHALCIQFIPILFSTYVLINLNPFWLTMDYISKLQWACFIYMMKWFCINYCNNFSIFYIIYTWIFKNGSNLQWTCHGMAIIFQMEKTFAIYLFKGNVRNFVIVQLIKNRLWQPWLLMEVWHVKRGKIYALVDIHK